MGSPTHTKLEPMKTLTQHLSQYASYHRDRRNIATHFIGIPMIVAAIGLLLAQPLPMTGGLSAGMLVALGATGFYLRLDKAYGALLGAMLLGGMVFAQQWAAHASTSQWLCWSLGLFAVGWVIQFVGHYFEGRKPAFVDDAIGLLIGPLFVLAEAGFLVGWRKDVELTVMAQAGATR